MRVEMFYLTNGIKFLLYKMKIVIVMFYKNWLNYLEQFTITNNRHFKIVSPTVTGFERMLLIIYSSK